MNDRAISQPQGRAVGGSSAINGLAFIPPSAVGIDQWGKVGNSGWSWDVLEPYYTKFRNLTYPDLETSKHLGFDEYPRTERGKGPLHASFTGTIDDPLPAAWFESFQALGWAPTTDPFSGTVQGGFTCASSIDIDNKTRTHSGIAYYLPARDRANLELQTSTIVEKIILEGSGDNIVARGVQWSSGGGKQEAHATKEVILAAGVYGSPKLLEL